MARENSIVEYTFTLGNNRRYHYVLRIDEDPSSDESEVQADLPLWTRLSYHRCPNCPLNETEHTHCPVAARLSGVVDDWSEVLSHGAVAVEVKLHKRLVVAECTAQQGLSSLLGLMMATSDCPHTQFFRPMARFHLPFASHKETLFRAASTYLLAKYFACREQGDVDFDLSQLVEIYTTMQDVNRSMAKRIQSYEAQDASTNAMVLLHILACVLPMSLDESLEQLRSDFKPVLNQFFTQEKQDC